MSVYIARKGNIEESKHYVNFSNSSPCGRWIAVDSELSWFLTYNSLREPRYRGDSEPVYPVKTRPLTVLCVVRVDRYVPFVHWSKHRSWT